MMKDQALQAQPVNDELDDMKLKQLIEVIETEFLRVSWAVGVSIAALSKTSVEKFGKLGKRNSQSSSPCWMGARL